jgi:uncharacterized protein YlaN (UPF0358 family)
MEKYKEKAKDILCLHLYPNRTEEEHKLDIEGLYDGITITDNVEVFLDAMCELAKEIEFSTKYDMVDKHDKSLDKLFNKLTEYRNIIIELNVKLNSDGKL